MTTGDILLKLLPFTHADKEGKTVFTLIDLSLGDSIITFITLVLWGIFTYYIIKMTKSKKQDEKKIDYLLDNLSKYKESMQENYNDFLEDLKGFAPKAKDGKENDLYLLWNEFHESLIRVENPITYKLEYRNSFDAEYFFNKQSLLTHIGTKLYSTVPSILLGLGLIGTFLGLFVGLVQLKLVGDASAIQASMQLLIGVTGVKFASSIWGLGLSLLFTVFDKRWEKELEDKLDMIQKIINEAFERRTSEQSLEEICTNSMEQKLALNGLAATLTEKLSAELNATLVPRLDIIGAGFGQIGQDISSAIMKSLEGPLAQIANTVESASKDQGEQSTHVLETMIERFISKIDEKAGDQSQVFQQNIESTQILMGQVAQNLTDFIRLSQETFNEQNRINSDRDRLIISNLESIRKSQNETIESLVKSVSENVKNLTSNMENSIGNISASVTTTANELFKASSEREQVLNNSMNDIFNKQNNINEDRDNLIISNLESIRHSQNETILKLVDSVDENIKILTSNINETVNNMSETVRGSTKDFITNASNREQELTANLSTMVLTIDKTTQKIAHDSAVRDEAINLTLNRTQNVFENAIKAMQDSSNGAVSNITIKLNESISALKQDIDQIMKNIASQASTFDSIISQSARRLEKVPSYLDTLDDSVIKLQTFSIKTAESSQLISKASSDLNSFSTSMNDYTNKMENTVHQFEEVSEVTKKITIDSKETYNDIANQYNDLLNQNEQSMIKFQEQVDSYKNELEGAVEKVFNQFNKQLGDFAGSLSGAVGELNDAIIDLTETREIK